MKLIDFILIVFSLLIIYLIYKTRNLEKLSTEIPNFENFQNSIEEAVNAKYTGNIDAIRNLASLTTNILQGNDLFTMPATNTYLNNVIIEGTTRMKGPVLIEGKVDIVNRDTVLLNLLPRYMIIAWFGKINVPLGWAICDGNRYKININTGIAGMTGITDLSGILTPDLRGRFILGAGVGGLDENNKPLTLRTLGEKKGTEDHILIEEEMPSHNHDILAYHDNYAHSGDGTETNLKYSDWGRFSITTENKGGKLKTGSTTEYETAPHNNMPPYYVLTYIMKI